MNYTVTFTELQEYLNNWERVVRLDDLLTPEFISGGYTLIQNQTGPTPKLTITQQARYEQF